MENHFAILLEGLSWRYRKMCLQKLGSAHGSVKRGHDYFKDFAKILTVSEELGVSDDEYLRILVDECARIGRPPVPPSLVASSIGSNIVKMYLSNAEADRKAKAAYSEVVSRRDDRAFQIEQLKKFRVAMTHAVRDHVLEDDFFPEAWKAFYHKTSSERSIAEVLDGLGLVPDAFKSVSLSWCSFMEQQKPYDASDTVVQAYRALFPKEEALLGLDKTANQEGASLHVQRAAERSTRVHR